jgi:hypothetical protein
MELETWDEGAKINYGRAIWSELVSMRFVEQARSAFQCLGENRSPIPLIVLRSSCPNPATTC